MAAVLERVGRMFRPQVPVEVASQEVPTPEAPKAPEKPKTFNDIFKELEALIVQKPSLRRMQESFQELGKSLLGLSQEFLADYKRYAEEDRREWDGHFEIFLGMRDQDGLSSAKGIVEIGKGVKLIERYATGYGVRGRAEDLGVKLSLDGKSLHRVWQEKTGVSKEGEVLLSAINVRLEKNEITGVSIKLNIHPESGYRPVGAFVEFRAQL